jgi:nitrous oxidase accessory protein NosD
MKRRTEIDLADLVAAAKPGATLVLDGRTFSLRAPLIIDKRLTLRGRGARTVITGTSGNAVLIVHKRGRLVLERLSLVRKGAAPGHVILCEGVLDVRECTVNGGKGKTGNLDVGVGVWGRVGARISITRSILTGHDSAAVLLTERARGRVERNELRKALSAVQAVDSSHAEVVENVCTDLGGRLALC